MTLRECIDRADSLKPNQYSDEDKVRWLSILDNKLYDELLMKHHPVPDKPFTPYSVDHMGDRLIAPFPYDELYVDYLKMKVDEENEETTRYNNSAAFFESRLNDFRKHVNMTQMPLNDARFRFF